MTQKDKELLLRDLCARVPYGVKCKLIYDNKAIKDEDATLFGIDKYGSFLFAEFGEDTRKFVCKPYLFPLSSMTEEQKEELNRVTNGKFNSYGTYIDNCKPRNWNEWGTTEYNWIRHQDVDLLNMWLNKNHFDYRGLIEKGLAIDATGLNIY